MENLEALINFIREAAEEHGFNAKEIYQLLLAGEEAIVNVIKYAYQGKAGDIEITKEIIGDNELAIQIIDWGTPFDPTLVDEPDLDVSLEERKIGGLGIFIMRKIMDEVVYKREDNKNILTLIKY